MHRCEVCGHPHVSTEFRTIVKENGKEFTIILCALCTLMFAGLAETGCHEEVNHA